LVVDGALVVDVLVVDIVVVNSIDNHVCFGTYHRFDIIINLGRHTFNHLGLRSKIDLMVPSFPPAVPILVKILAVKPSSLTIVGKLPKL